MKRVLLIVAASATLLPAQSPVDRAWTILNSGLSDKSSETRSKAAHALGLIANNAKAQKMAEQALSDPKPEVQAAAADALGQMGAKSSAPKLLEAVKHQDTEVVFAAANALYVLGDPKAYEIYYAVLMGERKSGDSLVESQMKMLKDPKALASMGFEAGIGFIPFGGVGLTAFKLATKDDVSPVRAAAAQKLVRDADPKTTAALMKSASDGKWMVRAAVADAIAKRGDPALLKAVTPLLGDSNDSVRFTAAGAVLRLSK